MESDGNTRGVDGDDKNVAESPADLLEILRSAANGKHRYGICNTKKKQLADECTCKNVHVMYNVALLTTYLSLNSLTYQWCESAYIYG